MSMVKKLLFFLLFLTVSLINAQDPSGLTLSEARPFCSDSGAQFPNTHNGSNSLPGPVPIVEEETMADEGFGCLFPQLRKNPTWFYMRIASSGDLNLNLTSFRYSNGADLDTDFVAWGPFTEDNFNSIISDGTGIDLTGDNLIDCQYTGSGSPLGLDGEIIYIEDASIDDYYIVLITNYAGVNGYSQLTELYPSNPDTATTDCFVNDAPTITSTAVTEATEDVAYTYEITTEDIDGDLVTVSATGLPSWLTLTDNTLSGTPTEGEAGSEITITATDDGEGALTATQTFTIVVTPVNDALVAVADIATVSEDAATTSIDVIANDTSEEEDTLTLTLVNTSGIGTVSINLDGVSVDYTPSADFNGTEVITYTVSDGTDTATGTLTVTVTPVNDAPVAIADTATVSEDTATTSIEVIANDTDVDSGDILSLTSVSTSGTGIVSINSDGFSVDYTPSANFNGTEVITYTVSDGTDTATGTLTVTVTPVNDAPIAVEDTASVLENAIMISTDVISNDIDVDGDILLLSAISYSGLGTVIVNVDELSIDYTPAPNFIGTEVINYSVTDGVLSSEGVLNINVITPEEIQITKPELNIPKFFTPNGDGINDTWNIKWNNISNYKIIEVNIYNRYGKILKKLNSFDNGWDGTYNGKLMPPNDYWVAIKLVPMNETKRIIIETSNFSLIR